MKIHQIQALQYQNYQLLVTLTTFPLVQGKPIGDQDLMLLLHYKELMQSLRPIKELLLQVNIGMLSYISELIQ